MGKIQHGEVGQFCHVAADLGEPIVGEMQSFQRMHPAVGTADGQVRELVVVAVQVNLGWGEGGVGGGRGGGR